MDGIGHYLKVAVTVMVVMAIVNRVSVLSQLVNGTPSA